MSDTSLKVLDSEDIYRHVNKVCKALTTKSNEQYRLFVNFQRLLVCIPSDCEGILKLMSSFSCDIEEDKLNEIPACCAKLRVLLFDRPTPNEDFLQHKMGTITDGFIVTRNMKTIETWPNFSSQAQELYKDVVEIATTLVSINVSLRPILSDHIDALRSATTWAIVYDNALKMEEEFCDGMKWMSKTLDKLHVVQEALQDLVEVEDINRYPLRNRMRDFTLRVSPLTICVPTVQCSDDSSDEGDAYWSDGGGSEMYHNPDNEC